MTLLADKPNPRVTRPWPEAGICVEQGVRAGRGSEQERAHHLRAAWTPQPSNTLREPSGVPWQVEMEDDGCVLQIHALREKIRREQQRDRLMRRRWHCALCTRREAGEQVLSRETTCRDARSARREHADSRVVPQRIEVRGNGAGILTERDDARMGI